MQKQAFEAMVKAHFATSPTARINAKDALDASCAELVLFEEPLFAYGHAQDPMFWQLQKNVLGAHFRMPLDWCSSGKTVISIFAPLAENIVASNGQRADYPSKLWLHGRYEGQNCLTAMAKDVMQAFMAQGVQCVCPCLSAEFMSVQEGEGLCFTSNWSERHIAYVCGMGTFGLSKGIITEKGMAGRLISFVVSADFVKTPRTYDGIYDYCTQCGACITRCPVQAISLKKGKEHIPCSRFIDEILTKERPRYACGKCQVLVPCSRKRPVKTFFEYPLL